MSITIQLHLPRLPWRRILALALALVLAVLLGQAAFAFHDFSDVDTAAFYHDDVHWLKANGITLGCGGGNYCPNDPVTRGQMAAFLHRAANVRETPDFALTTLDSPGNVGFYTSATLGVDGRALISYIDATNGNLKIAHCSDLACTSATITPLDNIGFIAHSTSVAIGADGLGLISYLDGSNFDLEGGALLELGLHGRNDLHTRYRGGRRLLQLDHDRRRRPRTCQLLRPDEWQSEDGPLR